MFRAWKAPTFIMTTETILGAAKLLHVSNRRCVIFEIYPCCSGRSAVTFKVDAATSMQAPIPTPVLVWAQPVNPFTRHGVLCRLYDLTILAWMPSSRPTEYGHMSGSRGRDCGISGNPSKIGSQAQKNGDPGGGGPWRWPTLGLADPGAGGPKPKTKISQTAKNSEECHVKLQTNLCLSLSTKCRH